METVLPAVQGFMYPNEVELQWSVLIVLYPFITGLVAGAFILASLERVFNVEAVKPTYRLALLTALAFLLVAPLPLQLHLGHPERSLEMYLTPHTESAMAMFGFVYLWYLMVVLVLEIWLDYRKDIVLMWREARGPMRWLYGAMALWSDNISPAALALDDRIGRALTVIGIPSAFLLHGYVGFIFGSIKANPWWSTPLMPIVFLFSAIVSGIAAVMLVYMVTAWWRERTVRHGVPRHGRALPVLRLRDRLLARDARPDPPDLRGRRVVPRARLHGADAALHVPGRRPDHRRHAGAAGDAGGRAAVQDAGRGAAPPLRGSPAC